MQERHPKTYADGTAKVETQKTRASKGDPKSRLYDDSQFDVVAACMYGPLGRWEFRYKRSRQLTRDGNYPDRIAPIQRIDDSWSMSLRRGAGAPQTTSDGIAPIPAPPAMQRLKPNAP